MQPIQNQGDQPIIVLREGTERTQGRDAQRGNIAAAKAVASAVKTTIGPSGMDKMLVDSIGDVVITNDGVTILKGMEIEHPAAKMMVEVASSLDEEVGDGTTTAVVLAGELLKQAEDLIEQDIHPTVIAQGYRQAVERAQEILEENAVRVNADDTGVLKKIAATAMTGKAAEGAKEKLSDLAVKAVGMIAGEDGSIDHRDIRVEKKVGGSIEDSEIVDGVVIEKERVHPGMPKKIEAARILLLDAPVEFKKTGVDAEIRISRPDQLQRFIDEEEEMVRSIVDHIVQSGANVLFCQKGIDDLAQDYLARSGILAARRVKKSDMEKLSRATGGAIVRAVDAISPGELGEAGLIKERKVSGEDMIFVTQCGNPKAVSIILRGGTEHVVAEMDRAVGDAIRVVSTVVEDGTLLPGGGAAEMEVARGLRAYAPGVGGRAQMAIEAFAESMEVVPRAIAENAGFDPLDVLVELRSVHETGGKNAGVNVLGANTADMIQSGVVEPLRVKYQAISSAAEAANMILRIDDIISTAPPAGEPPSPEGMGGMPPGMPPGMM
ncbi:MAG: thermosome subunit alpha [Methanomicrobiaceae archaeon]|nr:thermosome subunit alpha [Methanomicrobiaceae archaeon]